jgi:deoxyribose-phosphate aldolase
MTDPLLQLNRRIDHAVLRPEATEADVIAAAQLCRDLELRALCVNPVWVSLAAEHLRGSHTSAITVAGFPLGASRTDIKVAEALRAASDGATEIDMVANIGWLRSCESAKAADEIRTVRDALPFSIGLKVIIECSLLSPDQQSEAVRAVIEGGAQFVKTGTGFAQPATIEQVRHLACAADSQVPIKAAGGIRTLKDCRYMLAAGATVLGSSSSAEIIKEWLRRTA